MKRLPFKEVIVLAFPLIISTSAWTIQHFVDRMFLAWYSTQAVAASMPAGLLNMLTTSIFVGTAVFTETFVAQYYGAKQFDRIGSVMWQGIYIGLIGAIFHLALIPFAAPLFHIIGHAPDVIWLEIVYYQTLCLGAGAVIASGAVAGFFAGRGKTKQVMIATLFQTLVNIFLDYVLIFGKFGVPALGMKGAGLASVISAYCHLIFLLILATKQKNERDYKIYSSWKPEKELFKRILRFGIPSGLQGTIDLAGFTIFLLLLGKIGTIPLAATNIAFNINTLAFMPMIGIGMAVSILVGQNIGANNPQKAQLCTWTGFVITFSYMFILAILYVTIPDIFIKPFSFKADPFEFEQIQHIAVILLRFVAFYSLFDGMNIIFASALRGAGDTKFIMLAVAFLSILVLIVPSIIFIVFLKKGIYIAWTIATIYVIALALMFFLRFKQGKWKTMKVIEKRSFSSDDVS
ncbi:MAG: MATE family efflux transporter [Candidatus Omnitrophica bacterium]|nr:MATE family efflux transporter [Candidatus Omnitrophota bacterium]